MARRWAAGKGNNLTINDDMDDNSDDSDSNTKGGSTGARK